MGLVSMVPGRDGGRQVGSRRRAARVAQRLPFAAGLFVAEDRLGEAASEEKRTQRPDGRGCVCPLGDSA